MVANVKKAAAPGRDNVLLERLLETSKQTGCVGFTLNREGYSCVKDEVDAAAMTLFGVTIYIVDSQRERARAYWNMRDLAHYVGSTP